ncbi:MAG: hypothetical protein J0H74_33840 [Chitinophagaceae bacterium]|nr:hypothetical protein [Chitinophagaceae bacterium]
MAAEQKNIKKSDSPATLNNRSEEQRLIDNINRSDLEKLHLFTQMLQVNSLFKKAKVIHK